MKKLNTLFAIALTTICISNSAYALEKIKTPMVTGTGSLSGAYYPMMNDVRDVCNLGEILEVLPSNGSLDNNDKIFGPEPIATSGIFQLDFVKYMQDRDPKWQNMVAIMFLHNEYVQVLTLDKEITKGGITAFGHTIGGDSKIPETFGDLKGMTVYSWGGSFYTSNILSDKFNLNLNIINLTGYKLDQNNNMVRAEDPKDANPQAVAKSLIEKGEGVAMIAVGEQNLKWVTEKNGYDKNWKILPVTQEDQTKVAGIYSMSKVNYLNLSGGQAQTLTVPAVLMTRNYRTPSRVNAIMQVQKCIKENIATLQDEGNSNWLYVDPSKENDSLMMFKASETK